MGVSRRLQAKAKIAAKQNAARATIRPKVTNARKVDADGLTLEAVEKPVLAARPRVPKKSPPPPAARPLRKRVWIAHRIASGQLKLTLLVALSWIQPITRPPLPQQPKTNSITAKVKSPSWTQKGRARALKIEKLSRLSREPTRPHQKLPTLRNGYGRIAALHKLLHLSASCSDSINEPTSHSPVPLDALLVCIDTESERHGLKDHVVEIGITFLDTRDIANTRPGAFARDWIDRMKTYHYVVDKTRKPVLRMRGCFFAEDYFGNAAEVRKLLLSKIREHFQVTSSANRKLILVGHSLANDLRLFRGCPDMQLVFTTRMTSEIPVAMAFDTTQLALEARKYGAEIPSMRLGTLVNWLGVHPQYRRGWSVIGWHNAGNDAAYTMMALLMLAVNWGHVVMPGYGVKSGYDRRHEVAQGSEEAQSDKMERLGHGEPRGAEDAPLSAAQRHEKAREHMGWLGRISDATRRLLFRV